MSLFPSETVGKLPQALHGKAKESPGYRFYSLYDKIYRLDVLWHAYRVCRFNDGAPGVDGVAFEEIESQGQTRWLRELADMPVRGFVGGCAASTNSRVRAMHDSLMNTCTKSWASSNFACDHNTSACDPMSPCPKAGCGKSARPV